MNEVIEALRKLVEELSADIALASTRIEHVRVSTRANEANNILLELERLNEQSEA